MLRVVLREILINLPYEPLFLRFATFLQSRPILYETKCPNSTGGSRSPTRATTGAAFFSFFFYPPADGDQKRKTHATIEVAFCFWGGVVFFPNDGAP